MNRGEVVFLDNFLVYNDSILEIVAFPGHESNSEVSAESQFTMFGSVAFGEYLTLSYLITFSYNRNKVYTGVLVCLSVFWKGITFDIIIKAHKFFFISTGVSDDDFI